MGTENNELTEDDIAASVLRAMEQVRAMRQGDSEVGQSLEDNSADFTANFTGDLQPQPQPDLTESAFSSDVSPASSIPLDTDSVQAEPEEDTRWEKRTFERAAQAQLKQVLHEEGLENVANITEDLKDKIIQIVYNEWKRSGLVK